MSTKFRPLFLDYLLETLSMEKAHDLYQKT